MMLSKSARENQGVAGRIDSIDRQILKGLQADGRMAISELARLVQLTNTPCVERVRRLERDGYIQGYSANVNAARLGLSFVAFIEVQIDHTTPAIFKTFKERVEHLKEVVECHLIAGVFDYLIKIRVADSAAFRQFLSVSLHALPGITRTRTYVSVDEIKYSHSLEL